MGMNKIRFFLVVSILVGLTVTYFFKPATQAPTPHPPKNQTLKATLLEPSKALKSDVVSSRLKTKVKNNGLSQECETFLVGLHEANLARSIETQKNPLSDSDTCVDLPEKLNELKKNAEKFCVQMASQECLNALFILRASVTDFLVDDELLETLGDKKIIFEKIYAQLNGEKPNFSKIKKLADVYLKQDPESAQMIRVALLARVASEESEDNPEVATELFQRYSNQQGNLDLNMIMLGVYLRTQKFSDLEQIKYESLQLIDGNPESKHLGHYIYSYYHWRNGDKQAALESVSKAIEFQKDNQKYQQTLERLKKSQVGTSGHFQLDLDAELKFDLEGN